MRQPISEPKIYFNDTSATNMIPISDMYKLFQITTVNGKYRVGDMGRTWEFGDFATMAEAKAYISQKSTIDGLVPAGVGMAAVVAGLAYLFLKK